MKKILLTVAVALLSTVTVFGQSKLSNYTALLIENRKAAVNQNDPIQNTIMTVNGKEYVDCFVHFNDKIDESVLAQYGVTLHMRYDFMNVVTAAVPMEQLVALSEDARIKMVEAGTPITTNMDKARVASHLDEVLQGLAPLQKSYLGRGVVVGVVDGDMQYAHPAFWNQAHTKFRIKKVWNQGKYSGGSAPSGFNYGIEYPDSASIIAAEYDTKSMTSGHATHVTGIAAGADHTKNYYGAAQEADIVYVSNSSQNSTSIADGIKYCIDYAKSVGKPCVVNVSMGSYIGPHDGSSTESIIIDSLVGPGYIVVGSAGNSGDEKIHAGKVLTRPDTAFTTFFSLKSSTSQYYLAAYADIYGDVNQNLSIRLCAYNKDAKIYSYLSRALDCSGISTVQYNVDTVIENYGRMKFNITIRPQITQNNRNHFTLTAYQIDSVPKRHNIGVRIESTDSGMVNLWTYPDYCTFTNSNQKGNGIIDGDSEYTVDEPMGVTAGVISVGSYVTYSPYASTTVGKISSFSSHGPTADNRIKPDIAAPGEMLMSAYPDLDRIKDGRSESTTVGGKTYYYGLMQGTSMSSPYCAGVIATWLEADPTLTRDRIIDVFEHTAIKDQYTGYNLPDNICGNGKLNAYAGLLYILGLSTKTQDVATTGVLVAYPNPTSDILNIGFPVADSNVRVAIYDLGGKCVYVENLDETYAGENLEISVADLSNGAYIVKVSGEKMNDAFKLIKQ